MVWGLVSQCHCFIGAITHIRLALSGIVAYSIYGQIADQVNAVTKPRGLPHKPDFQCNCKTGFLAQTQAANHMQGICCRSQAESSYASR